MQNPDFADLAMFVRVADAGGFEPPPVATACPLPLSATVFSAWNRSPGSGCSIVRREASCRLMLDRGCLTGCVRRWPKSRRPTTA